jgi:KipI family sensor histidine kinase inhibitor
MKKGLPDAEDLGRDVEVPVCYDAEFALDLADVSQRLKISPEEIIKRHTDADYRVLMVGFAPGHPYIGGLDPKLAVPRRDTPRAIVPAGSVAIANQQTVVYPYAISGGWSVIGRTPLTSFDAARPRPSLFAAGDRVRFTAIGKRDFLSLRERQ